MADAERFMHVVIQRLNAHVERGGKVMSVDRVVKRAAIELGVPGAADLRLADHIGAMSPAVRRHIDEVADVTAGALAACEALWTKTGYPESLRALMHLQRAVDLLAHPDSMPSLGAISAIVAGVDHDRSAVLPPVE